MSFIIYKLFNTNTTNQQLIRYQNPTVLVQLFHKTYPLIRAEPLVTRHANWCNLQVRSNIPTFLIQDIYLHPVLNRFSTKSSMLN